MNGFNFSERVRHMLVAARNEALRLGNEYVGTEHLLLGLLQDQGGVAAAVLDAHAVNRTAMRSQIEQAIPRGKGGDVGPELPYTSRAKKVLELAMSEARAMGHAYIGTEHLLLGMIAEERGVAAQVLMHAGVTLERARAETLRLLGTDAPGAASSPEPIIRGVSVDIVYSAGHIDNRRFATPKEAARFLEQL